MTSIQPPSDDTLSAFLVYIQARNPASWNMWVAESESEFIVAVETALEHAIAETESGARLYKNLCERGLSRMLASLLACASIEAVAEEYHNGHVDVTISHPRLQAMKILGECKMYDGFKHHCDGCDQVLNRYSSGRFRRVFCLDYFRVKKMYTKLEDLRDQFDSDKPHSMEGVCADHRIKGSFVSSHNHVAGTVIEILHCGCNLYLEV